MSADCHGKGSADIGNSLIEPLQKDFERLVEQNRILSIDLEGCVHRIVGYKNDLAVAKEALEFYAKRNWRSDGIYPSWDAAREALEKLK